MFDYKGVIEVPLSEEEIKSIPSDISLFPLDKYVDLAIEAEAEEVTLQVDEEGPYLRVLKNVFCFCNCILLLYCYITVFTNINISFLRITVASNGYLII